MKVLVTGGSGLVGRALQAYVEEFAIPSIDWIFLRRADGNLCLQDDIKKIFENHNPDIVVHLAANVGGLFKNMEYNLIMYEDNLIMNTFLLKYCSQFHVKKVICMLSTCIFPDGREGLDETSLHLGPPHPSNEGYAYAKRMIDIHSKLISETHNIPCVNLIPTNIYGKHDNFNLKDAHVVPALIHRCFIAKKNGEPFIVFGSGKPLRQFINCKDLAKILHHYVLAPIEGHHRVICCPPASHELSIHSLALEIASCFKYEQSVCWDSTHSDGQQKKTLQPSDAVSAIIGPDDWTPISAGLKETVDWFIGSYPNVRL